MAAKSKINKQLAKAKLISKKTPSNITNTNHLHNLTNDKLKNKSCCLGVCSNGGHCPICNMHLENQVRIIFGAIIVILIVLSHTVSHDFYVVTGIVGAIYFISGLWGKCPLRSCLRCIPCNKDKGNSMDGSSCSM